MLAVEGAARDAGEEVIKEAGAGLETKVEGGWYWDWRHLQVCLKLELAVYCLDFAQRRQREAWDQDAVGAAVVAREQLQVEGTVVVQVQQAGPALVEVAVVRKARAQGVPKSREELKVTVPKADC